MPVHSCQEDGKPGWKYGDSGKCYTYNQGDEEDSKRAHKQAEKQASAIDSTGWVEKDIKSELESLKSKFNEIKLEKLSLEEEKSLPIEEPKIEVEKKEEIPHHSGNTVPTESEPGEEPEPGDEGDFSKKYIVPKSKEELDVGNYVTYKNKIGKIIKVIK